MADTLSLKWIEGNDVVDVIDSDTSQVIGSAKIHNYNTTPTFNVDNPMMWGPLSVLSGLASGYCERRAILNPTFVTQLTTNGANVTSTALNWNTSAAYRDSITRNCMYNLAMGSSGDNALFLEANSNCLYPFGSAGTSNFMTAMDSAITALIVPPSGPRYLTAGSAFFTSAALIASATSAAAAADSAFTTTIEINGGGFNTRFNPALVVEWAQQRKWMLDELRWTAADASSLANLQVTGFHAFESLHGGIYTSAYSYTDAYRQVLNRLAQAGDEELGNTAGNGDGGGAISIVMPFSSCGPAYTHIFSWLPTGIIASGSSSTQTYDAYIDAPFNIKGETNLEGQHVWQVLSCRQQSLICGADQVYKVQAWTAPYIYVGSGATVTILAATDEATLSNVTLEECSIVPTMVTQLEGSSWLVEGEIVGGTITSGQFFGENAAPRGGIYDIASNTGIAVTGGTFVSGVIDANESPALTYTTSTYTISDCIVEGATLPPSFSARIASSGNSSAAIYRIETLTIEDGGVAYIDGTYVRGEVLNVCGSGQVYIGSAADGVIDPESPSFSFNNYVVTPHVGNSAAINIPNIFRYYCINNICYIDLGSRVGNWAERGVLVCTPGSAGIQVPSPYNSESPCITVLTGGSHYMPNVQKLLSSSYSSAGFPPNILVASGAFLDVKCSGTFATTWTTTAYALPGGTVYVGPTTNTDDILHLNRAEIYGYVAPAGTLLISSGYSSRTVINGSTTNISGMITYLGGSYGAVFSGGVVQIKGATAYQINSSAHAWNLADDNPVAGGLVLYDGAVVSTNCNGLKLERGNIYAPGIKYIDPTADSAYIHCKFVYDPVHITCTSALTPGYEYDVDTPADSKYYDYTYTFSNCPIYGTGDNGIVYNGAWYRAYYWTDEIDGVEYYKWVNNTWDSRGSTGAVYTLKYAPVKGAQIYTATYSADSEGGVTSEVTMSAVTGATVTSYCTGNPIGTIVHATMIESDYRMDNNMSAYYMSSAADGSAYQSEEWLLGATVAITGKICSNTVYVELNKFCVSEVSSGWNTLQSKAELGEGSGTVLAGIVSAQSALQALSSCTITSGGVSMVGTGNAASFRDTEQYSSITVGFNCYAYRQAMKPHDNYASFYVRQSATEQEQSSAAEIYSSSLNQ